MKRAICHSQHGMCTCVSFYQSASIVSRYMYMYMYVHVYIYVYVYGLSIRKYYLDASSDL